MRSHPKDPLVIEGASRSPRRRLDRLGRASLVWMLVCMASWPLLDRTPTPLMLVVLAVFLVSGPVSVLLAAWAALRPGRPGRRLGVAVLAAWLLLWALAVTFS